MRIDPAICALRGDRAAHHAAQSAVEAAAGGWRQSPPVAAVLEELAPYGEGAPLAECPRLRALVRDPAAARAFVDALIAPMIQAMGRQPLAHVPFRHQVVEGMTTLQLAHTGRARLSLVRYEPQTRPQPVTTVSFADGERHELCLTGAARARRVSVKGSHGARADLAFTPLMLFPGRRLRFAARRSSKLVDRTHGGLVLLRLARQAQSPLQSLEYRIADGALVHRAAGDAGESRAELMLAVLCRMGRRDAAPAIEAVLRCGSDSLRWQALREYLALDSGAGFEALAQIADDAADPLAGMAAALRRDLLHRYPQLRHVRAMPCPA